jgi:mono/diheme cytochrome c family protein
MVGMNEDAKLRGGCQGFALAKSMDAADDPKGEQPLVKGRAPKTPKPAAPKGRVFAPMVTVDPGETAVRSSGYGNSADQVPVEAPIVSVIDASAERALTRTAVADVGGRRSKECLLPRSAAFNASSSTLLVTCLGTDALVELDARGLDPARLERRRWNMPAGPTGVAVDPAGARAIVWSQFDRELAVVDLAASKSASAVVRVAAHRSAKSKVTPQVAWGRELFHKTDDARISQDGRACASCHPDGREDALTWSTPDGPRQTIMLAGRLQASGPFSWSGVHDDIKTHVKVTFQRLGGLGLPDHDARFDELDALTAYLDAMPAPNRVENEDMDLETRQLAARGKELFFADKQGCASCHVGGGGTDREKHDVGSAVPKADPKSNFDTPTLRFVGGTAPYFHDGRYGTLDELLTGSDAKMGHTMHLPRRDVVALKTYLETL